MKSLLEKNISKRLTAEQALDHPWFKGCKDFKDDSDKDPLDEAMLENLQQFKNSSKLRKAALQILVKMLPTSEI